MVRDCCDIFVEDEQHLEGFMFNRRRDEKERRHKAKQFLKEVNVVFYSWVVSIYQHHRNLFPDYIIDQIKGTCKCTAISI